MTIQSTAYRFLFATSEARRSVAIVLLSSISITSFYLALRNRNERTLRVVPETYEFGNVQQGELLETSVSLVNDTDTRIELNDAFGSCHCTTAGDIRGRVLEPRGKIQVPVRWDISGRREHTSAQMVFEYRLLRDGDLTNSLSTDVPTARSFRSFRISAFVEPEYRVSPEKIVFAAGEVKEISVSCRPNRNSKHSQNLRVVDYGSNDSAIKVRAADPHDDFIGELIVSFDPAEWARNANHLSPLQLQLMTNSKFEPLFVIPIEITQGQQSS